MPHVIVKLYPGRSEQQKQRLAAEIAQAVKNTVNAGDDSISIAIEEVSAGDWAEQVYKPDIVAKPETIYKKPGYNPL